jgi:crotonobetainyl-CoA hydratase
MDVQARTDGPVLVITLDRPKANAIDVQTSQALYAACDGADDGRGTGATER